MFSKLFSRLAQAVAPALTLAPLPATSSADTFVPPDAVNDVAALAATKVRVPTAGPTIAVVNQCTVLTDADIIPMISAIQIQIDRDFFPVWGITANLMFCTGEPPADAWVVYVRDTSTVAGALGFHDLTAQYNPEAFIFAGDDAKYGLLTSVTLSHEILEMLVDPMINQTVFAQETNTTGTLFAYEVCDACEADENGVLIEVDAAAGTKGATNGKIAVRVSDFVYPSYFEPARPANSTKFSHSGIITAPLQIASGGYLSLFAITASSQGWTQATAETGPGKRLLAKGPDSRKNRRARPH